MTPRLSLLPRLRQACRRDHRGLADAAGTRVAGALQGQDSHLILNRLFLSGVLIADPRQDEARDGNPLTLLLVAFPAPDERETQEVAETASCEIEVPAPVAERYGKKLRAGESVFISGQLSGGGGIVATEIHSGPAPERG